MADKEKTIKIRYSGINKRRQNYRSYKAYRRIFLLDKDGKIIAQYLRGEAPDARLQEILGAVNKISYTTALCDGLVSSRLQPWPVSL